MPPDEEISIPQLTRQLLQLGVQPGGVLLVHCAFSQVKPVENGPLGLIRALQDALGPAGTLVMPSMTDDDEHVFNPRETSCIGLGIVAQTFWQQPGVLRSDSPHAFAARGPLAAQITAPHPVDVPHGLDSPVGRVYQLDGQVLLLGVAHDSNTTLHLAEFLGGVRYRRPKETRVLEAGRVVRLQYGETDHCCENFNLMDGWLDAAGRQAHGRVGHAASRLFRAKAVIELALDQLRQNETVFLHPFGVDEQCDEARASLPPTRESR